MSFSDSHTARDGTSSTRVLITGAGGPAAVSVIRALSAKNVDIFAVDIDPHAAGLYLVPEDRRFLVPRGDDPVFADRVAELCREFAISVLIPTVDTELIPLARISKRLAAAGINTVLADLATLETCLDKLALVRQCEGSVPVPRSAVFGPTTRIDAQELPVVVKPRSGSGGRGVRIISSVSELSSIPRDGSHLVQEYLPGDEYSVDVFADLEGTVRAAVPRIRLKVDSGVAVASRTVHDPELELLARRVAEVIGLRFVANVQFRRDPQGVPRLLEVNPRFPGTMPLTVAAGVDMPEMALMAALGFDAWPHDFVFRELAVVRHWQEVFMDAGAFEQVSATATPSDIREVSAA